MDRRIRQVAGLITALLLAVAASAGWIQGLRSEEIAAYEPEGEDGEQARNRFRIFQECRWERGPILSIDGRVLAESVRSQEGRRCLYERRYPMGDLTSHVVGRWSIHFPKTGLEAVPDYNLELVGQPLPAKSIADLFKQRPRVGNTLVSTIDTRLQREALKALAGRPGGVVAMNPKTGAVYVAASNPSYDPNPIASNNREEALQALCELGVGNQRLSDGSERKDAEGEPIPCRNLTNPMTSVALRARRPPGSTFKVVTAAAALESGKYNPDTNTVGGGSYLPPGESADNAIGNYGGGACGGSLANALRVSCNTSFARVAVEIGAERFYDTAVAMGLDQDLGVEYKGCPRQESEAEFPDDGVSTGCVPEEIHKADGSVEKLSTPAFRARAGFGQWVVEVSPFGMAQVASTVANGGFVPRARFAERVLDRRGAVVREIRTGIGRSALSPEAASQLGQMMRGVVTGGTASRAFGGAGYEAAGKTGTADQPTCSKEDVATFNKPCPILRELAHAWFIAFAPVDDPAIAIAVLVARGGGVDQATGGRVAAPVARQVLDKFFDLYPAARSGGDD
jgi:peptidoglycan glycosyltransferase